MVPSSYWLSVDRRASFRLYSTVPRRVISKATSSSPLVRSWQFFLDPPDPPTTALLYDSSVALSHPFVLKRLYVEFELMSTDRNSWI